ncbi:AAA family ATPase (plasmid) [Cereibacter azotoformans]|uniref:3'-5' exonuclease n=1 Tax=Cereibacter azotoformans TaxID=43057 RepID=UPI001F3D67AE|nr:3'-5' exonuclease [Cereibacter azotoformans]UIJ33280.1 AAA family ATPase [Cereibacter azotoformans]
MKHLGRIVPSAEQLKLISANQTGAELIRGSAGSGKTTTALLRLKSLAGMMRARKERTGDDAPVKFLLLTFNRTLAGYVRALAESQISGPNQEIEIRTFAKWAMTKLGVGAVNADSANAFLRELANRFAGLDQSYVVHEAEYLMGRFESHDYESYIATERAGRGALPRVDAALRRRILDEVIYPYRKKLGDEGWLDWNSLALKMRSDLPSIGYDIIIVDESQDFSANEIRAIKHHLADDHAITFVIDTAQRIYARGFTWAEAGIDVTGNRSHRLRENHRNTREIAAFASSILTGIPVDPDGALPNLAAAQSQGPLPKVISGNYSRQIEWVIDYITEAVDLTTETVAFLKPEGGRWFDTVRHELRRAGMKYVEMQRNGKWPDGDENIALSTFHSAKGLEFDHVIIIGFNQENTPFGDEEITDQIQVLRRLLAVAVARARKQVIVGYKPGEESRLTDYFDAGTYEEVHL